MTNVIIGHRYIGDDLSFNYTAFGCRDLDVRSTDRPGGVCSHFGSMTGSLQKKLNAHWARCVPDKRLAIQLLRVTPFIFMASRSTMGSLLCCDVEEPFAVLSTSNQYPRIYDGNLWISAKFVSYVRDPLPKCSRRIRVIETCFWLIRILSYSIQYLEEKKEHFAFIESFSIIQEFHTDATVFSQMIGVTEAINNTNKNHILSRSPVRKKTIPKKKRVDANKNKCDFPRSCSNIHPTENPPQHYSPLKPSPKTSFIVDSLPGVFAVDKPTNYIVTNSPTVIENKENIPITEAPMMHSTSPCSKDSSLFKDLFDSNDDYSIELKNLSNSFMTSEILTPFARLSQNNNTDIITSEVAHPQAPVSESQDNKLSSPSTQYFSVQDASDFSILKTSNSSVMEINSNGQLNAKRPRNFASTHSPTALRSAITVSSPIMSSISLTDTNRPLGSLEFSSCSLNRSKSYSSNPVNTPRSLPMVRHRERQRNPLHEVVSFSNSSDVTKMINRPDPNSFDLIEISHSVRTINVAKHDWRNFLCPNRMLNVP
ncbi:hypothetical protein Smp_151110 [Schistosoma mansoni]|uniref:hypothetical protein n=1 Tax=Schistosoma mansoni TaxID=6183 RepID=UPI0001A63ADB|nr:hypothetical protein Smp_151110 [Schistosoma mansoni]|eukprot:XP_018647372.1 hypothetical protein Smp_151110 [Schistosoma mansoni]